MQYITGIEAYDNAEKTAVTLGKFDGLHRGHQKLVDKIKEYEKEGKMHLIIGIGCTGGQHRSVSLTNYFADHYSKVYQVHRLHRDADH